MNINILKLTVLMYLPNSNNGHPLTQGEIQFSRQRENIHKSSNNNNNSANHQQFQYSTSNNNKLLAAPKIVPQSRDTIKHYEGSTLILTCTLESIGASTPTFEWFKDNQPLTVSNSNSSVGLDNNNNGHNWLETSAALISDNDNGGTSLKTTTNNEAHYVNRRSLFSPQQDNYSPKTIIENGDTLTNDMMKLRVGTCDNCSQHVKVSEQKQKHDTTIEDLSIVHNETTIKTKRSLNVFEWLEKHYGQNYQDQNGNSNYSNSSELRAREMEPPARLISPKPMTNERNKMSTHHLHNITLDDNLLSLVAPLPLMSNHDKQQQLPTMTSMSLLYSQQQQQQQVQLATAINNRIVVDSHVDHSLLKIRDLIGSDSGDYKCLAKNQYGDDSSTTRVIVNG